MKKRYLLPFHFEFRLRCHGSRFILFSILMNSHHCFVYSLSFVLIRYFDLISILIFTLTSFWEGCNSSCHALSLFNLFLGLLEYPCSSQDYQVNMTACGRENEEMFILLRFRFMFIWPQRETYTMDDYFCGIGKKGDYLCFGNSVIIKYWIIDRFRTIYSCD